VLEEMFFKLRNEKGYVRQPLGAGNLH